MKKGFKFLSLLSLVLVSVTNAQTKHKKKIHPKNQTSFLSLLMI